MVVSEPGRHLGYLNFISSFSVLARQTGSRAGSEVEGVPTGRHELRGLRNIHRILKSSWDSWLQREQEPPGVVVRASEFQAAGPGSGPGSSHVPAVCRVCGEPCLCRLYTPWGWARPPALGGAAGLGAGAGRLRGRGRAGAAGDRSRSSR